MNTESLTFPRPGRGALAAALLGLALLVAPSCDNSDPVALDGDEIDIIATFTMADEQADEFEVILRAIVENPNNGVRRQGVLVRFRVTVGAGLFLSDTEVRTNDEGEAFTKLQGQGSVTVEAKSGTATETIDLSAAGGSIGENQRPEADVSFTPSNPSINQSITFDVSDSDDPDGNIERWEIDFGDGSATEDFDFGTRTDTTHTYTSPGDFDVRVTVTDDEGATDDVEVTVTVQ